LLFEGGSGDHLIDIEGRPPSFDREGEASNNAGRKKKAGKPSSLRERDDTFFPRKERGIESTLFRGREGKRITASSTAHLRGGKTLENFLIQERREKIKPSSLPSGGRGKKEGEGAFYPGGKRKKKRSGSD